MNPTFAILARIYPALVLMATLAVIAGVLRVWSRMSSGSVTAGPVSRPPAPTIGLEPVPWAAPAIADTLDDRPGDLLDRLIRSADSAGIDLEIPTGTSVPHQIRAVLDQLESALQIHRPEAGPVAQTPSSTRKGS